MILFQWLYSWNYRDYCLLFYSTIFPTQFYSIVRFFGSSTLFLLVWTLNLPSWSSLLTLHNVIFTKVDHFKWIQFKMTDDQIVKSLIRIENLKIISCLFMYAECFTFNFWMQYVCMCRPYWVYQWIIRNVHENIDEESIAYSYSREYWYWMEWSS